MPFRYSLNGTIGTAIEMAKWLRESGPGHSGSFHLSGLVGQGRHRLFLSAVFCGRLHFAPPASDSADRQEAHAGELYPGQQHTDAVVGGRPVVVYAVHGELPGSSEDQQASNAPRAAWSSPPDHDAKRHHTRDAGGYLYKHGSVPGAPPWHYLTAWAAAGHRARRPAIRRLSSSLKATSLVAPLSRA